jgi:Holliday junction resolvase RusA-like endonuclease
MIDYNNKEVEIYQKNHSLIVVLGERNYFTFLGKRISELYPDARKDMDNIIMKSYGDKATLELWDELAGEYNDVYKIFNKENTIKCNEFEISLN